MGAACGCCANDAAGTVSKRRDADQLTGDGPFAIQRRGSVPGSPMQGAGKARQPVSGDDGRVSGKYAGPPPAFFANALAALDVSSAKVMWDTSNDETVERDRLMALAARGREQAKKATDDRLEKERASEELRQANNLFAAEHRTRLGHAEVALTSTQQLVRDAIQGAYDVISSGMATDLAVTLQRQRLAEALNVDMSDIGYGDLLDDVDAPAVSEMVGMSPGPDFNLGKMFSHDAAYDGDDGLDGLQASRHATFSALDWEQSLRGHTPSRRKSSVHDVSATSVTSSRRSHGIPNPSPIRSQLLDRHPLLKLGIDEVGDRDELERDGLGGIATMRLNAYQVEAITTRRRYTYPRLLEDHERFVNAIREYTEALYRADIEQQWFYDLMGIYKATLFTGICRRAQWEGELKRIEARRNRRRVVDTSRREEERLADKLRWEIERVRLAETKPMSAAEKLRIELDMARSMGADVTSSPGRKRRDDGRALRMLEDEEARHRGATMLEEGKRWEMLRDHCAEECPWIVNHPNKDLYIERKNAEVVKWKLISNGILARDDIAKILGGDKDAYQSKLTAYRRDRLALKRWGLSEAELLAGQRASLCFDETTSRDEIAFEEEIARSRILDELGDDYATADVHAKRRRIREWGMGREERTRLREASSNEMLQRVGRGLVWRRRLGPVLPIAEEVRDLIGDHSRGHKNILLRENIARGDIFHHLVQEARLSAVRMANDAFTGTGTSDPVFTSFVDDVMRRTFPRVDVRDYPWDPSTTIPVEELERDLLYRAFLRSFDECIGFPAKLDREAIEHLPQHMIGVRLRSVIRIQRAFRGFVLRRDFNAHHRDRMVIAKLLRVRRKAELRFVMETEREERYLIEDAYNALGLHRSATREEWFSRWQHEDKAATVIQALARGVQTRTRKDPRLLAFFEKKMRHLRFRRALRPPVE